MDAAALAQLKRQVSNRLLDEPGISGVGLRADAIVVYLASDDAALRAHAAKVAKDTAPGARIVLEVTGTFGKQ